MPRKMRRAALRSALSVKAADEAFVLVEGMALAIPLRYPKAIHRAASSSCVAIAGRV
jgi:ribosomal protein L4